MTITEFLFDPFLHSDAMKRALAASLAVSIGGTLGRDADYPTHGVGR